MQRTCVIKANAGRHARLAIVVDFDREETRDSIEAATDMAETDAIQLRYARKCRGAIAPRTTAHHCPRTRQMLDYGITFII